MRSIGLLLFVMFAAEGQEALTLDQAVSSALAAHPLLAEANQRIASVEGQRRQAGLTFNPKLILQSENTRFGGDTPFVYGRETDNFAYLQQTFETAGKRGKRVELASHGLRRAQLESEVLRRQIAYRVRHAYWAAAGAQRAWELLEDSRKNFLQVVEYHEIRVREGAMAESDLLRVRLESERIMLAANNARLDAERARILLFREMGQMTFPQARLVEPLELKEDRLIPADLETAMRQRPELELARVRLQQARAALTVQEASARPNVDGLFGYKRSTGYNTMVAGLQVDLPFLNRNQGNIESATAEVRMAESSLSATDAIVRAEVSAARVEYELRRKQVTEFLGRFRAQAAETAKIAQAAYRLGGADLLRLLDAERLRIEIELVNYRAIMEYRQSIVALEAALGVWQ
jgi:cobalt-zinc-cadmium efflux system outer membrane protein